MKPAGRNLLVVFKDRLKKLPKKSDKFNDILKSSNTHLNGFIQNVTSSMDNLKLGAIVNSFKRNSDSKKDLGDNGHKNFFYGLDWPLIWKTYILSPYKKPDKSHKWKTEQPTITMRAVNSRTNQILASITSSVIESSRIIRLEELLRHLIQYPQAKNYAVKKGAVGIVLSARNKTNNPESHCLIRVILAALGYVDPPRSSGIRILSIDGGGMRGIAVIKILQRIEEITGKNIYELFDFICGVSTGAIITCSLIPPNQMPIARIYQLYRELSCKVFNQSAFWGTSKLVWSHAYYDTALWEKFLKDYVGNENLLDSNKFSHCPKIAVVSTIVNRFRVAPFVFRNYASPCYKNSEYYGSFMHTMFEAVRASAAAPTIFEEFKTGDMLHQDGGITVNNPAAIALHEAKCLWPDESVNCMVSIGCGKFDPNYDLYTSIDPAQSSTSWKQIFEKILESATETEAVHRLLNDLLPPGTYFRLNPHLSTSVTLDETNEDKLKGLEKDTELYCRRNEYTFFELSEKLKRKRPYLYTVKDSVISQLRLSGLMS